MEINVGTHDRTVRIVAGLVLIAAGIGTAGWTDLGIGVAGLAGLVGAILLVTGWVRMCPIYRVLGLRTDDQSRESARRTS